MFKSVIACAMMAVVGAPCIAFAQSQSGSTSQNANNINVISQGADIPTRQTIRTVGQAIANAPGTGIGVCSNGNALGGGFIGGAVSIALSNKDKDCNARAWIGVMGSMAVATGDGRYIETAKNIACDIAIPGKAFASAGIPCPRDTITGRAQVQGDARTVSSGPPAGSRIISRTELASLPAGTAYWQAGVRYVKQ